MAFLACAPPAVAPQVRLDGLVVRALRDPLTELDSYDAATLFHLALEEERKGRPVYARRLYERLLEELPESGYAWSARFNLALLHEAALRWAEAAALYRPIVSAPLPAGELRRGTWLDAHFRLAVCESRRRAWWRAAAVFDAVLANGWLSEAQRLEALVGRGIALQEVGEAAAAETAFAKALSFVREVSRSRRFDDRGFAAEAAYRMGEISRARFEAVALEFPQAVLSARLEEKCQLLLAAQSRYLRAIRYGDAHTVAIAGLRIGGLYESLHAAIVNLRAPIELNREEAEVYHELVRQRVHILAQKALAAYERTLAVGRRAGTAAEWVARLEDAVVRLRRIFLDDAVL